VLAFDNLSSDAEMAYFSDGVSEEILQTVARGSDLKVIGRGSSFQFRGAQKAASHVAHALRATHVLDGSVRRSGAKVRIAANLIDCASETTLWSDRFDRELSDVFALQDEIAGAVAAALKVAFAPSTKAETVDPAAYTLYLKARELRNRGLLSPTTVVEVIELLDEATRLAPRFARAWEFLATMQVEHLRFGEAGGLKTLSRAEVAAAAETALNLDPGLGAAHQALGRLEPFGRFAEREAFHSKALSVAPSDPTVLTNASLFFAEVGRMRDALDYAAQAYALDPMYPWVACWYGYTVEIAGRDEELRRLWEVFCNRWPDNELITWGALGAACHFGDWTWWEDLVRNARSKGFDSPSLRAAIAFGRQLRSPDAGVVARWLSSAEERLSQSGVLSISDFTTLSRFGQAERVFALIEQASFDYMFNPEEASPNGAAGSSMMFNPGEAGAMMRDIRFVGLCAKLGLCDYWVKTGRWPDCADAVAPHYDFRAETRRLASP
jgi:TolB-like protein